MLKQAIHCSAFRTLHLRGFYCNKLGFRKEFSHHAFADNVLDKLTVKQ